MSGGEGAGRRELDETFERDKARLHALCLRMTGRADEAEDALHDTWLAAVRSIPSFRGEASLSTWLYRIAIRAATRVRTRRRAGPLEFEPVGREEATPESRERLHRLLEGLDRLGVRHRTVLSLSAVEGLSAADIAEILDVPEGTVWSRLSAARRELRKSWKA